MPYRPLAKTATSVVLPEKRITPSVMKSIITSFVLCILSIGSHAADRVDSLIHRLHSPADGSVMVAAHRGDWRYAPENSIAAIEHCIEAGADIVELDLRMTKDSVLIVMHDATLDRTTTGKGYVADWTADSIRLLHLKNGCGIKTIHKVPTLEEAMIAAKGKILVNLDKADTYFNLVLPILRNTGTARQVIMKSGRPAHEILSDFGEGYKEVIYMPKINFEKPDAMQSLDEAIEVLGAPAHELKYATSATLPKAMEGTKRLAGKSRIWYNTLWDTQCGGHDDEAALKDSNAAYGFLIDSLKADIIQTDRLQLLLNYLKKRKLNAMPTDTIPAASASSPMPDGQSEWTAPTVAPKGVTIAESYLKGKKSPETNEDGIVVTPGYIAIIDGATSKSDFSLNGRKSGRLAMEIVSEAIATLPAEATMPEAMEHITSAISGFYRTNGLEREIEASPNKRFVANGVIYSIVRREIWQIGDCRLRYADIYSRNEKEIDRIMAQARAAMNEAALASGMTRDQLMQSDPGRAFIKPFLERQALLQNNNFAQLRYSFPVFDGTTIDPAGVKVFTVPAGTEVILASDGYPEVLPTLAQSESHLRSLLEADPMCMYENLSTKGISPGNLSFDDRAYIRFTHH